MENEAEKWVAQFQDFDGETYDWLFTKGDRRRKVPVQITHKMNFVTSPTASVFSTYDATRYEFKDGSAIVNYDFGWDFGIHKAHFENDRVRNACRERELEAEFALCAVVNLDEKFQDA